MQLSLYLIGLVRDNIVSIALVAALSLLLSPYQIWKLLSNNRPGRGTGWRMWLADRYIQIWLAKDPLDSSDTPYELRMPMGLGDTVMDRRITRKTIDQTLGRYWLVRRSGDTVSARRDIHLFICSWTTYFFCRWYLTLFCGDSRRYYEELSHPPSRIQRLFKEAAVEMLTRILKAIVLLALIFVLLKVFSWLLPFLLKLLDFLFSHIKLEAPQIKIPNK
ncbi:MAG: hypothetical protein WC840_03815 [Candidatus Peribacteraceae bacterium]